MPFKVCLRISRRKAPLQNVFLDPAGVADLGVEEYAKTRAPGWPASSASAFTVDLEISANTEIYINIHNLHILNTCNVFTHTYIYIYIRTIV